MLKDQINVDFLALVLIEEVAESESVRIGHLSYIAKRVLQSVMINNTATRAICDCLTQMINCPALHAITQNASHFSEIVVVLVVRIATSHACKIISSFILDCLMSGFVDCVLKDLGKVFLVDVSGLLEVHVACKEKIELAF